MSREILFRGKTDNEKWVYGFFNGQSILEYRNDRGIITKADKNTHAIMRPYPIDIETLGQYTGLTDKNGKRIFEGDIVKFTDDDGDYSNYEVYFDNNLMAFMTKELLCGGGICDMSKWEKWREMYEVIGNIHDNPELLESED